MCQVGLLTEAQLEHALSVQESTGRPLGEVIVTLGYASAGAVANALAEQYGGTLRTEYGVSAGLGRPKSEQPTPVVEAGQLRTAPARVEPAAQVDEADAATAVELEERAQVAEQRVEELESRLAELDRLAAEGRAALERAEAADREADALRTRIAELDADLGASRKTVAELTAELEASRGEEQPPEEEHLLFVPSAAGYSLTRRRGSCPEPGSVLQELGGRMFVVARIGPSPLGGRLRCAYLEPAP